jgi:hypothetical protein
MEDLYNKHYININEDNYITNGYSDAFQEPNDDDICINEEGGRHFELLGVINPQLLNEDGCYIYKYEDGKVRKATEEEIYEQETAYMATINYFRGLRTEAFISIDFYQKYLVYNDLTDEQKEALATYRRAWLDVTDTRVVPTKPDWM